MPYFVCHKCGLSRKVEEEPADLGACNCLGQTIFEFEETPRTRDEAIVLGVRHYLEVVRLFLAQGRNPFDFERIARKYQKVLEYRAVYKVTINAEDNRTT